MENKKAWSTPEVYTLGISSTELLESGPELDCVIVGGVALHGLS